MCVRVRCVHACVRVFVCCECVRTCVVCVLKYFYLPVQVCQYYIKENAYVVLGSGDTGLVTWNVTDSNNFIVTYRGGDRTYDGKER